MSKSNVVAPKFLSSFKNPEEDEQWLKKWIIGIKQSNRRKYERISATTSLGTTEVFRLNASDINAETLVIFPGARTSVLFWDLNRGLDHLRVSLRIFLVETNGLPNLSHGASPDIHSNDYGHWANEVLEHLKIEKAFIAGASFGGLICMKLAITNPEKVRASFLLNPGCLQPFSMSVKNLYYNILPIILPTAKNVKLFLDNAVFCKPTHNLAEKDYQLLLDYEIFALTRWNDKTQKPYFMNEELRNVNVETHLIVGDKDLLFPFNRSIQNAKKLIRELRTVKVFENVGHGIETFSPAIAHIGKVIREKIEV